MSKRKYVPVARKFHVVKTKCPRCDGRGYLDLRDMIWRCPECVGTGTINAWAEEALPEPPQEPQP